MVNSLELVVDPDTDTAVRKIWDMLRCNGIRAQSAEARPHVTLVVADRIDVAVLADLAPLSSRFPLSARLGTTLVFGGSILARLVVPTAELLDLHAEVTVRGAPYLRPGPLPHTATGQWTPHVTLARRVEPDRLADAIRIAGRPADLGITLTGLRLWDGATRTETLPPITG